MLRVNRHLRGIVAGIIFVALWGPYCRAQAGDLVLPKPSSIVGLSRAFHPPVLTGLKIHPNNPCRFDFILDRGDFNPRIPDANDIWKNDRLNGESNRLIRYFLAGLTIPEQDIWVNLSPYERDRIMPQSLGLTEMGRDLLADDYMLKQITASLIYPEGETGRAFWKRVYSEAARQFNATNIPVNTFNKVWIIPKKAVVYENAKTGTAYVVESKLTVMLEEDYLALEKARPMPGGKKAVGNTHTPGSEIVREIVVPQLIKEVNEGRNFARLRQVYNSLILALWYKKRVRRSLLAQVYANKRKMAGIAINGEQETKNIYDKYLQSFKNGVYNYIKEEKDALTQAVVPRKYFSGGFDAAGVQKVLTVTPRVNAAQITRGKDLVELSVDVVRARPVDAAMSVRDIKWIFLDWDGTIAEERGQLSEAMILRVLGLLRKGYRIGILTDTITQNNARRAARLIDAIPSGLRHQLMLFSDSSARGTGFNEQGDPIELAEYTRKGRFDGPERARILALLEKNFPKEWREERRSDRINPEFRIDLRAPQDNQKNLTQRIQAMFSQRGWPYKVYMGDRGGNIRIVKSHKEDAVAWVMQVRDIHEENVLIVGNEGRQGDKDHELLSLFPRALNVNVGGFSKTLLRANSQVLQLPFGVDVAGDLLDVLLRQGGIPATFLLHGQLVHIGGPSALHVVYAGRDVQVSKVGNTVLSGPVNRSDYTGYGVRFLEVFDVEFSPDVQRRIAESAAVRDGRFIILSEQEVLQGGTLVKDINGKPRRIRLAGNVPVVMPNFLDLPAEGQEIIHKRFEGMRVGWSPKSAKRVLVSGANQNRIKIGDDGYLFMRQGVRNGESIYIPVGGAYRYSAQTIGFFRSIGASHFGSEYDLRFMLPMASMRKFEDWFTRSSFRERNPLRELFEELVTEGQLLDAGDYQNIFGDTRQASLNRLPPVARVDVFNQFRRADGLGQNAQIAFIVKNAGGGYHSASRREQKVRAELQGNYYGGERINRHREGGGFLIMGPVRDILNAKTAAKYQRWEGDDPYAYEQRGDEIYFGSGSSIFVINARTGVLDRTLSNPRLSSIHSLEFSPENPDVMLVSSEGSNQIYEINIHSGKIVWEWDAFTHGYGKNKLGLTLVSKGQPVPTGPNVRVLSDEEARDMMERNIRVPEGQTYVNVVDFDAFDSSHGLARWRRTARPNWSGYRPGHPGKILATLFNEGEAVEIDKATGDVRVLWTGLLHPHGIIPIRDGYVITDTGWGRVLLFNLEFELIAVYDFSGFPRRNSMHVHKYEWLQNTYPLTSDGRGLLASVDSRRNTLIIWDPVAGEYSDYKFDPHWIVQSVMPVKLDQAQLASRGGIDLTSMQINSAGGISTVLDPAMLRDFLDVPGFVPEIVNIQPLSDVRLFLGLEDAKIRLQSG